MATEDPGRERQFEVAADLPLTGLGTLPEVSAVSLTEELHLDATYFDTPNFRLLGAGITLCTRIGHTDAWTLQLPGAAAAINAALTDFRSEVPIELLDRVRAWVRDHDVHPMADIRTRRSTHCLLSDTGRTLARVCEDSVTSSAAGPAGGILTVWRDCEIELIDGPPELLEAAGALLLGLGATEPGRSSDLDRALGRTAPTSPVDLSPESGAGVVLRAYLQQQVGELLTNDNGVRHDEPDSVHKMRVSCRRLRSALSTFRPLLDRQITDPIRNELTVLATILGGARDAEVQRARFDAAIKAEPAEPAIGPVQNWIDRDLSDQYRRAHGRALLAMNSTRYFRLLDRLDDLAGQPPLTAVADQPANVALTQRVQRAHRRLAAQIADARKARTATDRDHLMHEARKGAKALRYALEAVAPAFGAQATAFAVAVETVQEILGEHQDSVIARQVLGEMAARAFLDGQNTFTFGRLHALEEAKAATAEHQFNTAWSAVGRRTLRRGPR